MTVTSQTLILFRGSDVREALLFKADEVALNMTGHTIELFEPDPWFASGGSVAWTDQAAGEAVLILPWNNAAPNVTRTRIRVKRTADDFDDGYPEIIVRFL